MTAQQVKSLPANAGDTGDAGSIPGLGRSPSIGNSNPLQYSCLENPTDRGAWQATVYRAAKSQTRLKKRSTHLEASNNRNILLSYNSGSQFKIGLNQAKTKV